jgi:hypothetical protein
MEISFMKAYVLVISGLLALPIMAQAQPRHGGGHGDAFDAVVDFVDPAVADELTSAQVDIQALRDELTVMRSADEVDEAAIDGVRNELRDLRSALSTQVRDIVQGNEELRTELRGAARMAREDFIVTGYALRDDDALNDLLAAASGDDANAFAANQDSIVALQDEIRAARDAGADREATAALRDELRTISGAQRDLVGDILDANEDLQAELLSDARETVRNVRSDRRDARDGFRDDRRPGRGDRRNAEI